MSNAAPVSDLVEEQILVRAAACADAQRRAGVELLVLAYEWAVAHPGQRLDPREKGRPGREQARSFGGDGTPEVTEFRGRDVRCRDRAHDLCGAAVDGRGARSAAPLAVAVVAGAGPRGPRLLRYPRGRQDP